MTLRPNLIFHLAGYSRYIWNNGQNIHRVPFLMLLGILFGASFSKRTIIKKILFQSSKYFFTGWCHSGQLNKKIVSKNWSNSSTIRIYLSKYYCKAAGASSPLSIYALTSSHFSKFSKFIHFCSFPYLYLIIQTFHMWKHFKRLLKKKDTSLLPTS